MVRLACEAVWVLESVSYRTALYRAVTTQLDDHQVLLYSGLLPRTPSTKDFY